MSDFYDCLRIGSDGEVAARPAREAQKAASAPKLTEREQECVEAVAETWTTFPEREQDSLWRHDLDETIRYGADAFGVRCTQRLAAAVYAAIGARFDPDWRLWTSGWEAP